MLSSFAARQSRQLLYCSASWSDSTRVNFKLFYAYSSRSVIIKSNFRAEIPKIVFFLSSKFFSYPNGIDSLRCICFRWPDEFVSKSRFIFQNFSLSLFTAIENETTRYVFKDAIGLPNETMNIKKFVDCGQKPLVCECVFSRFSNEKSGHRLKQCELINGLPNQRKLRKKIGSAIRANQALRRGKQKDFQWQMQSNSISFGFWFIFGNCFYVEKYRTVEQIEGQGHHLYRSNRKRMASQHRIGANEHMPQNVILNWNWKWDR